MSGSKTSFDQHFTNETIEKMSYDCKNTNKFDEYLLNDLKSSMIIPEVISSTYKSFIYVYNVTKLSVYVFFMLCVQKLGLSVLNFGYRTFAKC